MRRLWRVIRRRRTVTWVGIFAVAAAVFVRLTYNHSPNAIVKPALSWLLALLAWALAVLFWDLAIVWIEYVSQRRHLEYLNKVWGITRPPVRPPEIAAPAEDRERIWWTRT